MAKDKQKFYVVWKGLQPGIYLTWDECNEQVFGVRGAQYKAYSNRVMAESAFKNSYYVVWRGHKPGVYQGWEACRQQIEGYEKASYDSFASKERAEKAFSGQEEEQDSEPVNEYEGHYQSIIKSTVEPIVPPLATYQQEELIHVGPILDSFAVDAACTGNPGPVEYRGVHTSTGEEVFRRGPFPGGSNNIGEFLAIVHGLAYCQRTGVNFPIYSDSQVGMSWVKQGKCKTQLEHTPANAKLFELIKRAENWLQENQYENHIYQWDTKAWGDIPADFNRK